MLLSQAQVRTRVKALTDSASDPVLADPVDIDLLMAYASKVDLYGNIPDNHLEWATGVLRIPGDTVVQTGRRGNAFIPVIRNGFFYTCSIGGISGATEPVWPVVIGAAIADGAATWLCSGVAPWNPTYDVYYAVSQGWLLKSTRLAGHYNFMSGGKMFSREQFFNHCMTLHKKFAAKSGVKSIRLGAHSPLMAAGFSEVETSSSG